jgi:hypothetical protein
LLDRAEQAVAAARRAAISDDDPRAALAELAAVAELAHANRATDVAPAPNAAAEHAPEPPPVTESVTNSVTPKTRPVTRKDVIDVDTVRVERGENFESQGIYCVLSGDSILLGYLERDRRRRWRARTATTTLAVPGGPWRTRQDALVGLLLNGGVRTGAQ